MQTPLLAELIDALRVLPGVGQKTAQRMAFHLLQHDRQDGLVLAETLQRALRGIRHCTRCRNFAEETLCPICASSKRDASQICVVETPADVDAIESAGVYQGQYFVLMGHLSPIDGIGPDELGLDALAKRLAEGDVSELILALNPSVEGEATAWYIQNMAREHGVKVSRLAQGVPFGAELEYLDQQTLAQAFQARQQA
ncbi:DNA replication and repair protein RecR [Sulfurivirga caldicuralii]|uniref:Recombination protein RecR n=1 Tax=Sulfurivirga caldicuralii TaxID=364032 RepID=A0A1N6DY16_9GAMM|nr:recombination mediator RecR [Sulfurivirga caldicuralii]SIN75679.1 DNA replication and repair protein RecR [Sulfurivirga caldicuralii]